MKNLKTAPLAGVPSPQDLGLYIDHTLLRPDATEADIAAFCQEAVELKTRTVCLNSSWISFALKKLAEYSKKSPEVQTVPIAVVGFPLGTCLTEAKAQETRLAVQAGAAEIDMVIHVGRLKANQEKEGIADIEAVVKAAHPAAVKVILETGSLTDDEIRRGCQWSEKAGAAFVKTSTGFGAAGATERAVRIMRETVGDRLGVKASGGIRTYDDAAKMIKAGANRIGASATRAILGAGPVVKTEY
ncbi:MAG: deoxyribose-phosphate aldolase [Bdellovibrionales bacterium]|nr:deoxyribose-phosphate aldolase [Bdellovibrionales bacterium]